MMDSPRSHLYLIGYRGCGKSSVGREVANRLGLPFVDTDDLVESKASMSIAQIFDSSGEAGFREMETEAIRSLPSGQAHVVALGGGAVLREENRRLLRSHGRCVWLSASPELLAKRIASDQTTQARRPSLSKLGTLGEIELILEQREPIYRELSELTLRTDGVPIPSIARSIVEWWTSVDAKPEDPASN